MSMTGPSSRPRVSICLPTHHGRAEALDRALRSIAAQRSEVPQGAFEVCVSDNGSRGATQGVLCAHRATFGERLVTFALRGERGFTPRGSRRRLRLPAQSSTTTDTSNRATSSSPFACRAAGRRTASLVCGVVLIIRAQNRTPASSNWQRRQGVRRRRTDTTFHQLQVNPLALAHLKQQPGQTLALDVRLLACIARHYWFSPSFWIRSLPVLLLPRGPVGPSTCRRGAEPEAARSLVVCPASSVPMG